MKGSQYGQNGQQTMKASEGSHGQQPGGEHEQMTSGASAQTEQIACGPANGSG